MKGSQFRWALVVEGPPAERRGALSTRDSSTGASGADSRLQSGAGRSFRWQQSLQSLAYPCMLLTQRQRLCLNFERHVLPFFFKEFGCGWCRGERAQCLLPLMLRVQKNHLLRRRSQICRSHCTCAWPDHYHPTWLGVPGEKEPIPPRSPTKIQTLPY